MAQIADRLNIGFLADRLRRADVNRRTNPTVFYVHAEQLTQNIAVAADQTRVRRRARNLPACIHLERICVGRYLARGIEVLHCQDLKRFRKV
jgi:glucose-6-phosphate dehydrogenase assembly protein OpcA